MRLTADTASPDYFWNKILDLGGDPGTLIVTVDGVQRTDTVEADDAEGWADVIAIDDAGNIIPNEGGGGAKIERVHGTVSFAWKRRPDGVAAAWGYRHDAPR